MDTNRPKESAHYDYVKKDINSKIGDSWRMKVYDSVEDMSYSNGTMTVSVAGKAYGDGYNYEREFSPREVHDSSKGLAYIAYRAKQAGIRVGKKVDKIRIVGYKD